MFLFPPKSCGVNSFGQLSSEQLDRLCEQSDCVYCFIVREVVNDSPNKWFDFVRTQLGNGGGLLLEYISKLDKAYLNADVAKLGGTNVSPSRPSGPRMIMVPGKPVKTNSPNSENSVCLWPQPRNLLCRIFWLV